MDSKLLFIHLQQGFICSVTMVWVQIPSREEQKFDKGIYIYIRLKIKPNSIRIRFLRCQIFVLPSTIYIYINPCLHEAKSG